MASAGAPAAASAQSIETGLGPASARPGRTRLERGLEAVERNALFGLAAILAVDLVLLLYMGRGLTFFYDEWDFVQHDYGGGWHSLVQPHVGNIVFFPVIVYKVLFHVVGLNHYAVYRLVAIGLHLISGGLVYTLASRRVSRVHALLAAALIVFLGAAWEDLLWAFQIGYLLSIATGLGAWLAVERRGRVAGLATMALLVVSIGSSSLGIAITAGIAVELLWRRDWRALWIVAVPVVLYALWYLGYGESQITKLSLIDAPGFAEDLAGSAAGALVGHGLDWGRPLALIGVLFLLRRLARPLPVTPRLAGLITAALVLWFITAAARSTISPPETSRYLYLGSVLVVLIAVELLTAVPIAPRVTVLAAAIVLYAAITGLTLLHNGSEGLRSVSGVLKAELGAMELDAARAPANFHPDPSRAPTLEAGTYLHTVRAIGSSPADDLSQLVSAGPLPREAADAVLVTLDGVSVQPTPAGSTPAPEAAAPVVVGLTTGTHSERGDCTRYVPAGPGAIVLRVASGSQLFFRTARGPAAEVFVRRFGDPTALHQVGSVAGAASGMLVLPPDRAGTSPWYVNVNAGAPVQVCT